MKIEWHVLTVLLSTCLHAQASGQCLDGPCDEPHGGLGCVVDECCEAVCDVDANCCSIGWDEFCATIADEICAGLACPGAQPCDQFSTVPGCDDRDCCRLTCDHDWYCCSTQWDAFCIDLASDICDVPPCELSIPTGVIVEAEPCDERLNDGCNILSGETRAILLGDVILGTTTTSSPRDTDWFSIEIFETSTVRVFIESEFPAQLVLQSGVCAGPLEFHSVHEALPCAGARQIDLELAPGTWHLIVAPGFERIGLRAYLPCELDELEKGEEPEPTYFGVRYLLSVLPEDITCSGEPDLDGDGMIDGADLTLLLVEWGGAASEADLDCDGVVGGGDLALLLSSWSR
ncbi:MAG: hypothetical protein CMJ33_00860 [Phycisphaerae bacterium]|nr:hypothetical protein [Phycisphaerae bacterium]HAW96280.1 hypothetical protein [Phycisphaerales bacterium]